MSELPTVNGKEAIKAFEKKGFSVVRVSGSHHTMKKAGHPYVLTVPVHGNKTIKKGTLRGLINAAGMSVSQFVEYLD